MSRVNTKELARFLLSFRRRLRRETALFLREEPIPADVSQVLDTAALLQVTEFHLFEIAYQSWYGRDASEKSIERYFVPYMFRAIVPFWVRQLCRRVLAADARGALDPAEFGVTSRRQSLAVRPNDYYLRVLAVAGAIAGMLGIACSLVLGY